MYKSERSREPKAEDEDVVEDEKQVQKDKFKDIPAPSPLNNSEKSKEPTADLEDEKKDKFKNFTATFPLYNEPIEGIEDEKQTPVNRNNPVSALSVPCHKNTLNEKQQQEENEREICMFLHSQDEELEELIKDLKCLRRKEDDVIGRFEASGQLDFANNPMRFQGTAMQNSEANRKLLLEDLRQLSAGFRQNQDEAFRTFKSKVAPVAFKEERSSHKERETLYIPIPTENQLTSMDGSMEEEVVITTEGGLIETPGTGVSLEIPPGALEEEQLIKMRIVSDDYQDELSRSFGSNSSVVVELLPSTLKLQKPAKLTLPHSLVLKKGCEWKAKIYTSHHEEKNQLTSMDGSMEEEVVITTEGGLIETPGAGVSLEIPPGALEEEQLIKMRIVSDDYQDELSRSFGSNSSVVVELLPSTLKLQKPAKLTLPHSLVLKKGCEWKAKIYTSHHEERNQPFWEKDPFASSELHQNYCEIWLQHLGWEKFQVDNKTVEGKRIILYAARRVPSPNSDAYVDVGFYLDLPGGQQAVDLKNEDILGKQHVVFHNKDELPLTIWFEDSSSIWTCSPEEANPKEIAFQRVATSSSCHSTFVLKEQTNLKITDYSCNFKAGQGTDLIDLIFPLQIWRPPISKFASDVKTANIMQPPAAEETMETSSSAETTKQLEDLRELSAGFRQNQDEAFRRFKSKTSGSLHYIKQPVQKRETVTERELVAPVAFKEERSSHKERATLYIPIPTENQLTSMDESMEEEVEITTEGGLIEIPGTGVSLKIPPGALEEKQLIKMRIVLDDYQDELSRSFGSNSSIVVELLPSNLKLQKPAKLTLPHCLVLKKGCEWKAKIYTSHHEEGNQPFWEEDPFALSELHQKYCVIWLQHFCWETFQVGNKIVEGKRIVLYAARSVPSPNSDAYVDVGFYLDLPGGHQAVDLKKEDILRKQHVVFYNKEELPLTILFKDLPSIWTCSPEEENPKKISVRSVAHSKGCFSTFVLKVQGNWAIIGYSCYFKAGQGTDLVDLKFPLQIWRPPISKIASGVKTVNIKQPLAAEETMETSSSAETTTVPSDLCSAHLSISRGEPQKTSGLPSDYAVSSTCPECIDVLQYLAQHITVEWQVVGRKLHLTDSNLETIMDDNKGSNQRCYKMLTKWIHKNGSDATYTVLGKALEEADRKDLQEYVYDNVKISLHDKCP